VSVLACAEQAPELGIAKVAFEESQEGPAHAPAFRATATTAQWGREHRGSAEGGSKQEARQRAAVALLRSVAGLLSASPPKAVAMAPPPPPSAPSRVLPTDPISAVHELATRERWAAPAFSFEQGGAPHVPAFTCTLSFGGGEHRGEAGTKQAAKRAACVLASGFVGFAVEDHDRAEGILIATYAGVHGLLAEEARKAAARIDARGKRQASRQGALAFGGKR
jgi:hypothetical protein